MHAHSAIIEQLGGGTTVSDLLTELTGRRVDRERVYKWRRNGVPWEFRVPVARILIGRGLPIPAGFLPDGIEPGAIRPAAPPPPGGAP